MRDLLFGRSRYSELAAAREGIPTNILAQRLKQLEQGGIIERRPSAKPRSRYDYCLTKAGLKLAPAIRALAEWGHSEIAGTRALPLQARRRRPKSESANALRVPILAKPARHPRHAHKMMRWSPRWRDAASAGAAA